MAQYKKRKNLFGKTYYVEDFDNANKLQDAADWLWNTLGGDRLSADDVVDRLRGSTDFGNMSDYFNNMSDEELLGLLTNEYGLDTEDFAKDVKDLQGVWDIPEIPTFESVTKDMGEMPDMPDYNAILEDIYSGGDEAVNKYLAELQADEDRQTSLLQNQLTENNRAFDDYRSQVLSNQYQQNAQLMGTVGSEMSRARRNAIEAGASAGMRIAENVNTVLSMQNKQSQLSLETSNQLAQQLLNQRQAAMGITGSYNEMLSKNSAERRGYKDQAADTRFNRGVSNYNAWNQQANDRYNKAMTDYNTNLDKWNSQFDTSSNSLASGYQAHLQKKQSQYK